MEWDGLPVCCDVYWFFHGWRHLRKGCWSLYVHTVIIIKAKQKAAQVIPIVISSTGVIPKSLSQSLTRPNAPEYIYTGSKICNSWHMFSCKKLFKLQIRPPSLILVITTFQDRRIFPSQSREVRNSVIIILIIKIANVQLLGQLLVVGQNHCKTQN